MMWTIETYDRSTKKWEPFGKPTQDFGALYAKSTQLARHGFKTRVTKLQAPAVDTVNAYSGVPYIASDGIACAARKQEMDRRAHIAQGGEA